MLAQHKVSTLVQSRYGNKFRARNTPKSGTLILTLRHVQFSKPASGLEDFVRFYVQRKLLITSSAITHPVPARPTPMIVFDFGDPVEMLLINRAIRFKSPPAVVVGPTTHRRGEMLLHGTVNEFGIVFQPDGLQRLFSLPTHELTDVACDVHGILGPRVSQLWQILGNLSFFEERVLVVNEFLFRQAVRSEPTNAISMAVSHVMQMRGCIDIAVLADAAGMSPRHLARRFIDSVGMRPKLFARIVRFQAALESKALHSGRSWTDVAHEFRYFDQMHMIHDFEQLAGGSPKEMLTHLETVFVEEIKRIRSNGAAAASVSDARLML